MWEGEVLVRFMGVGGVGKDTTACILAFVLRDELVWFGEIAKRAFPSSLRCAVILSSLFGPWGWNVSGLISGHLTELPHGKQLMRLFNNSLKYAFWKLLYTSRCWDMFEDIIWGRCRIK